ncbi:hypothetical protein QLQ12_33930 [Actinoplanes sp. NEAU-A12]|uniref:Uncharacterized protein n=1 Tax=Actinoplanes sandaracinus TaxID=3045177 RepID=A0ABT6WVA5_9ACTN|nr:hypothetical protein [Actinoplanes sandaracinus]MDI6103624.1 hypothetical protein [Actinoplanes sandaracinus]
MNRETASREVTNREAAAREAANQETAGAVVKEPKAKPSRPRRAGVVLAVLFSLLALLLSAAAGLFSWRTFEAVGAVVPQLPVPVASPPQSPAPRPPQPEQYRVAYAKEPLRLQLTCSAVVHLDLDEPRADVAEHVADLRYESACGSRAPQLSLGAGAAGGSRQASADTDAAGCDRAVRTSPLGRGLQVEVREGTAICVLTAAAPAELVLVEIIDVGGSGTAGLRATSWQVP